MIATNITIKYKEDLGDGVSWYMWVRDIPYRSMEK